MLTLIVPETEWYDESREEFVTVKEQKIQLEHSLVSISKWESKWQKPYLDDKRTPTPEDTIDYIKCMTITQNVSDMVYFAIAQSPALMQQVQDYINNKMTATFFSKESEKKAGISREKTTSELIYYWMISAQIPFECQKWHINRLLTLIKVCNIKSAPAPKMSQRDLLKRNHDLNAARLAAMHTKG